MIEPDDDPCPGEGRCHGSRSWCDACGDVARICDAFRCDRHRCLECNEIRLPENREHWAYICDVCDPPDEIVKLLAYRAAVARFALNLAIAGALCASFELGSDEGDRLAGLSQGYRTSRPSWSPGCKRSAPRSCLDCGEPIAPRDEDFTTCAGCAAIRREIR